ncbi:MAG: membrane protein insertion efficiency factor YidD [Spirochaetales bacterium]|nr:membrane protein insertion efficiency factor YidD [Spirochaetia bacterium]MDD7014120.1 membrane protein insertion efficiency factor YidD [Spirochaetales bacterium]
MPKSWIIKRLNCLISKFFILLIRFYQVCISPLFPPCCRFEPTCSAYGMESIQKFGPFKGLFLTIKRILKCNPFVKGGIDKVPEEWHFRNIKKGKNLWKKIQ